MRLAWLRSVVFIIGAASITACTRSSPAASSTGVWTWVNGASTVGQLGTYGKRGVASPIDVPGAREAQTSWTDSAGNLWMFGGIGYDSIGTFNYLNDLWKYSPADGEWVWLHGATQVNEDGRYGTRNVEAARNTPGARQSAVSWSDAAGNQWVFGGFGADASGTLGYLNDLWKYSPTTGGWTWASGADKENSAGHYGIRNSAVPTNVPGGRYLSVAWTDSAGNLWLFGGIGYDSTGKLGNLNDLWKFSPATRQWTWVSGANKVNAAGRYGTRNAAAPDNLPGARQAPLGWTGATHDFWLFGGIGYDSTGKLGNLNDLWKFSPATRQWTWVSGSEQVNAIGSYGTRNHPAAGNVPGARSLSATWTDSAGNLWLFGGSQAHRGGGHSYFNDLWRYNSATAQWTWMGGASKATQRGIYGQRGVAGSENLPGARQAGSLWTDAKGNIWLFGGYGVDSAGTTGNLNDLWEYRP
ncbi:MAG: kelch repeat-containing protein [Acidiferrobacterales bacterium]